MARKTLGLTPRETQILRALWGEGPLTVAQIRNCLPNPPTTNTVRKLLSIMRTRSLVDDDGRTYGKRYRACVEETQTRKQALKLFVETFCKDGVEDLIQELRAMGLLRSILHDPAVLPLAHQAVDVV